MVNQYIGLAFLIAAFALSLAALYRRPMRGYPFLALSASIVISFIAAYSIYGQSGIGIVYIAVGIAALSTALAQSYVHRPRLFMLLIAALAAGLAIAILLSGATVALAGAFAIGTISGLLEMDYMGSRQAGSSFSRGRASIEVNRDLIHLLIGVVVIAVLLLMQMTIAADLIFLLILAGYLFNNMSGLPSYGRADAMHRIHRYLSRRMERMGTTFGMGAIYLAAGVALLIGFIHNTNFLIFSIIALLFADPVATIVGIKAGGPKLPYNQRKSASGTLAFFVVAAFLGYLAIGPNAFIAAAILAVVESLEMFVDDNIRIAVVCTAIYLVAYL